MTQKQFMAEKETATVMLKVLELRKTGKDAAAHALFATLPMQPSLAKVMKEKVGADYLIKGGYNLSAAEAAFGPGWLTR